MRISGSTLIPLDPEIERTAYALRKAALDDRISIEEQLSSSFDSKEEVTIAVAPPLTMGDYCKRTDEDRFKRKSFDGNTIRDSWTHLAPFYETTSMCKLTYVIEDHVTLMLFGFSLIGRAKVWLLCLPNQTNQTWKELEDKFLEKFFTTTQFTDRRAEIMNFEQQEVESLYDSWERFKLLLRRSPNHNMNYMEQMQNFIKYLKNQTHLLLDDSAGGTIRQMTEPHVKDLIEKMCMNEYHSKSKSSVKIETVGMPKGMLVVDTHTALLAQIELLNKKLAESSLGKANVSQVQTLRCEFYGEEHVNRMCSLEWSSEEVQFANFQKNSPYSYTYNLGWKVYLNFRWSNNQNASVNQGIQQSQQASFQRKPSQLEETLQNFIKITQSSFDQVNKNHEIMSRNHDESIKNLETHIAQLSRQIVVLPSSSEGFIGNTMDNPKNETCKDVETDFGVITEKGKPEIDIKPPYPIIKKKLVQDNEVEMFEKSQEILATLQVGISFHEILELMPKFDKFMKELLKGTKEKVVKEHVNMTEKDDMVVPQSLPSKLKHPGKLSISCNIGGMKIPHAICDLGSSINIMSLKTVKELKVDIMDDKHDRLRHGRASQHASVRREKSQRQVSPVPPPTVDVADPLPPHTAAHDDPVPPPEGEAIADAEPEAFGGGPVDFSLLSLYPDHIARHIWDIEKFLNHGRKIVASAE
ncbi:uncharacterized protein LOC127123611 [Lathyrus oleraceus]|uniref:uncharacterized protein LOC127123611 n=1 Tax=Pisum sativum TaxID=3888 RepID=UPI0021D16761|nr:uncharacterized protein LOC127123611 [Pisum sativum]